MALIIEATNEIYSVENVHNIKLFLAGGITNCPDWQSVLIDDLKEIPNLTIYNPRRKNFPINDPSATEAQITWEYAQLLNADIIIYWFSRGSLNPIVLFELGRYGLSSQVPMIIGIDPEYERKSDVLYQTKLSRPEVPIVESLEEMSEEIFKLMNY